MKIFFNDKTFDILISAAARTGYDRGAKNAEEYFAPLFKNEQADSAEKLAAMAKKFDEYREMQRAKFEAYKSECDAIERDTPIVVGSSVRARMRKANLQMVVLETKKEATLPEVCLCAWYDDTFKIVTYWFPLAALTHA
jgi:hypothetical protein